MLNSNPYNENIQNSIVVIEAQLRKLDIYKGQGAKIRAHLHWIKEGNKGSKLFFQYLNYKHKKDKIGAISDEFGTHTNLANIPKVL